MSDINKSLPLLLNKIIYSVSITFHFSYTITDDEDEGTLTTESSIGDSGLLAGIFTDQTFDGQLDYSNIFVINMAL